MKDDEALLGILLGFLCWASLGDVYAAASPVEIVLGFFLFGSLGILALTFIWSHYSKFGKDRKKRLEQISDIPTALLGSTKGGVKLGKEVDLEIPLFLPDAIRRRHVHILGATGSGKTESIILNFLKQDVSRGYGSIILDAKGDDSFLMFLKENVSSEKLKLFDLSNENSRGYNPLEAGSSLEAAQRLFSSLTWSEEYYKSKALTALQTAFQFHFERYQKNPTLLELLTYFESPESYGAIAGSHVNPKSIEREFSDLSGLRDQIKSLTIGHLGKLLSPKIEGIQLKDAKKGSVIYFRLQSLLSPQAVGILGRLIINHLNFLAGTAHRRGGNDAGLIPIYLDEFASFACPEFADLISKARSAGFALHFSHQSIGDIEAVQDGFLNRITDNSATKIVLRINDPDSAEFFARSFGTRMSQKITQKVINAKEYDDAEIQGDGSMREVHQFRSSPDTFKTLPTGTGSVLIAHGYSTSEGASHVFKIQFPKLT